MHNCTDGFDLNFQVESIALSIISMLSSPNDESPANVEAAVSDKVFLYFTTFFKMLLYLLVFTIFSMMYCRKNGEKEGATSRRK